MLVAACGRSGRTPAAPSPLPSSSLAAAPSALGLAQAYDVVTGLLDLLASGDAESAWGLWAPAWQAAHPEAAWAAGPPLPAGAAAQLGSPVAQPGGSVAVPVRFGVSTPAGVRWADGSYTVALVAGQARIVAGGLTAPAPPLDLQAQTVTGPGGVLSGQADCAGTTVTWRSRPLGALGADSTVTLTGPDGKAVPSPPLAPFAFGTLPTACGDLFGDGGEELVLTAATTTKGAYRQASVYELQGDAAPKLLGQMPSVGDATLPAPESPDGLYPYLMVASAEIDVLPTGPVLAPVYWAFNGLVYRNATAQLPGLLQADLAARLGRLRAGETCRPLPDCAAGDILLAYYDDVALGQRAAGLRQLQALLPAADGSWLRQQAADVNYVVNLP